MDYGIVDTINRQTARKVAAHIDTFWHANWHSAPIGQTLMAENDTDNTDRAWLVGIFAARTPDLIFDGPADADWENLFHHFRAEVQARRERDARDETDPVCVAEVPARDGVGSR